MNWREREKGCLYTTPCGSLYHATRSCGKLKAARRIIATSSCALCGDVPLSGSLLVDDRSHHPRSFLPSSYSLCENVSASLRRRRLEESGWSPKTYGWNPTIRMKLMIWWASVGQGEYGCIGWHEKFEKHTCFGTFCHSCKVEDGDMPLHVG